MTAISRFKNYYMGQKEKLNHGVFQTTQKINENDFDQILVKCDHLKLKSMWQTKSKRKLRYSVAWQQPKLIQFKSGLISIFSEKDKFSFTKTLIFKSS